jgi:hypothetical protein
MAQVAAAQPLVTSFARSACSNAAIFSSQRFTVGLLPLLYR